MNKCSRPIKVGEAIIPLFILSLMIFTRANAQDGKAIFDIVWKKILKEPGQSGILYRDGDLFLSVHEVGADQKVNAGGRIFSNTVKGLCYDSDGTLKWEIKMPTRAGAIVLEPFLDGTSITPVADENSVWFLSPLGKLVCCDHRGKEKWSHEFKGHGNCVRSQLILYKDSLIVSLPVKKLVYGLHAFDKETGKLRWVSDTPINHVCQYVMSDYQGEPAIYATATELAHYKDISGNHHYLVSPETGKRLMHMRTEEEIDQGWRCVKHDGNFINIGKRLGREAGKGIIFTDIKTGSTTYISPSKHDVYFKQVDGKYEKLDAYPYGPVASDYTLSTLGLANNKLFYRTSTGRAAGIRCIDLKAQKVTTVEVPMQIIQGRKNWSKKEIVFTKGVFDAQGKAIFTRASNHPYHSYGWGHIVCTPPLQVGDMLYWLSGVGMVYAIDLDGEFTPEKVQTFTIDPIGEAWTIGHMAYHDGHLYLRSQQALFKVKVILPAN
jgi:outer membrane protein assembly factor BamB